MALKFQAIFMRLQMKIISGEWPEGFKIPTEMELCETFGVSRVTIRRALDGLVSNGTIARTRGRGSFVISQREVVGASPLYSHPDFPHPETENTYQLVLKEKIFASPRDVEQFCGDWGTSWPQLWHFRVLRLKNGIPSVLSDYYVPEQKGEFLASYDTFLPASFFEMMSQNCAQPCHFSRGVVTAIIPNEEICKALQVKLGSANLWCRGICLLEDGTVVGRCTNIFVGSQFEFSVNYDIEAVS
jgi:DNA-binding GntR family transcriptional regulator